MGGHVNMMDDVLISNLPAELLRSSLRELLALSPANQQGFVKHIRQHFTQTPLKILGDGDVLFPIRDDVSVLCKNYLKSIRCLFASKLVQESLPCLTRLIQAIKRDRAQWTADSQLEAFLAEFSGDVVQAMQALKECKPEPTSELEEQLLGLMTALRECQAYCCEAHMTFPFRRPERQVGNTFSLLYGKPCPSPTYSAEGAGAGPTEKLTLRPHEQSNIETFTLGPHKVPRLFNGFWQLSSPAWGSATSAKQEQALTKLVESGLVAADMADHYGDAELVYGEFRNKLGPGVAKQVYAATKWCVFAPTNKLVTREWVLEAVKERSRRLGGGRVELLQFHWYDYEAKEYLQILEELVNISKEHPDLVSSIGLCNFDSEHVEEACDYLVRNTGSPSLVSNQVQFSLLDSRPLHKMGQVCEKYGMKLLTYGSICGGFLSEKWLHQPAPEVYSESFHLTPSQRKYLDMIRSWGSWTDFQALLSVLSNLANQHSVTVTNIATRWVLQQDAVGAVIVGTRLGVVSHGDDNLAVFNFALTENDMTSINEVALGVERVRSLSLFERLGDCGNEYRRMH